MQPLPTTDQTTAFLEDWIARREALIKKHQLRAQRWRDIPLLYASEMRSLTRYTEELSVLVYLRDLHMGLVQTNGPGYPRT